PPRLQPHGRLAAELRADRAMTAVPPGGAATLATLPSAGTLAAGAAGGVAAVAVLALVLRKRPDWLAPLVVLALPFRVPISAEHRTVNLLIPLYVVVAAGALTQLLPRIARRELTPLRGVEWLLFGSVALYAVQA